MHYWHEIQEHSMGLSPMAAPVWKTYRNLDIPNLFPLAITLSVERDNGRIEPGSKLAFPHGFAYQFAGACNHDLHQPAVQHM